MKILQLFKKPIPYRDFQKILECFNISSIDGIVIIGIVDLKIYETIKKLTLLKPMLKDFYLPCKYRVYVDKELDLTSCVNILRQVSRMFGYRMIRHSKFVNKEKQIFYKIIPANGEEDALKLGMPGTNIVVQFN